MDDPTIRRCQAADWAEVRRLHVKLALVMPVVVDVELNDVLATPDGYWQGYVETCAGAPEQALYVAGDGHLVAMGHASLEAVGGMGGAGAIGGAGSATGRLSGLYVDSGRRGQGVGRGVTEALEAWLTASGATRLVCHIPEGNVAETIARSLGWRQAPEVFYSRHGLAERRWFKQT